MYEILNPDLSWAGEMKQVSMDNHSIHWQTAGTLTLIATATEENLGLLQADRFVLIRDTLRQGGRLDGLYVICNVVHDEEKHEITVNGKAASYLLHQRAIQERVLTDTTAGAALSGMVNDCARGLPILASYVAANDPAVIRYPMDGGAVDEGCESLMGYCGVGMEAVLNGGRVLIRFNAGRDLSGLDYVPVLGKESGWARNTSLTVDSSDFCNVAVGKLIFDDTREEDFAVGSVSAQGADRRELYIGEITQHSGETEADFRARASTQANATLAAHLLRTTISADISPADYGRPYLVGDLVRMQVGPVTLKKRITGATWLKDQSNDRLSLTMGDQLYTVVAEIREKEKAATARAASASVRAGGAAKAAAENKEAIVGIKSDFKALVAQVDDVVAGMDAYVLEKVFEDYKLSVANVFAGMEEGISQLQLKVETQETELGTLSDATATLETRVNGAEAALEMQSQSIGDLQEASAEITTRVDLAETSLQQKAEKSVVDDLDGRVKTVETGQATLGARVDDAETALDQKAEKTTVTDLSGKVSTIETGQATLGARVDDAEASIQLNAQNISGVSSSVATIQADVVELQGRVDVTGTLSVESGRLRCEKSIYTPSNVFANKFWSDSAEIRLGSYDYVPTEITSTSGTVLVLGTA